MTESLLHGLLTGVPALLWRPFCPPDVRRRQARREKAENDLRTRSHEIMAGEMAILSKNYRRELTRLYKVNQLLRERLAEYQVQVSAKDTN